METDQISVEQLNISFGDLELHDSEARDEPENLSDLWQTFRAEKIEEAREVHILRTDNGREKQLTVPKLTVRRNSGSSPSGTSDHHPFLIQERSSVPRSDSPGLHERRPSEPRKLLSIEKFMVRQDENEVRTNGKPRGKARDVSLSYSTQRTPGFEHLNPLVNPLLISTNSAQKSYENLTKITSRIGGAFGNESLPPLDKARTRRFSAPSSPTSFTGKGKYTSTKSLQNPADTLQPPGRKQVLSAITTAGNLPRGRDAYMVLHKKRQEGGQQDFLADNSSYICPDDFKVPLSTKLTEQLENEFSLIKGQNPVEKKKSRYRLTTQTLQEGIAAEGMPNVERKQDETSPTPRSLRSSNQTVHYNTGMDMFDPMFE